MPGEVEPRGASFESCWSPEHVDPAVAPPLGLDGDTPLPHGASSKLTAGGSSSAFERSLMTAGLSAWGADGGFFARVESSTPPSCAKAQMIGPPSPRASATIEIRSHVRIGFFLSFNLSVGMMLRKRRGADSPVPRRVESGRSQCDDRGATRIAERVARPGPRARTRGRRLFNEAQEASDGSAARRSIDGMGTIPGRQRGVRPPRMRPRYHAPARVSARRGAAGIRRGGRFNKLQGNRRRGTLSSSARIAASRRRRCGIACRTEIDRLEAARIPLFEHRLDAVPPDRRAREGGGSGRSARQDGRGNRLETDPPCIPPAGDLRGAIDARCVDEADEDNQHTQEVAAAASELQVGASTKGSARSPAAR